MTLLVSGCGPEQNNRDAKRLTMTEGKRGNIKELRD